MRPNYYWIVFNRIKRKHSNWTNKQIGTATYKILKR